VANIKRLFLVSLALPALLVAACASDPAPGAPGGAGGMGGAGGGLAMLNPPKNGAIDVDPVICTTTADAGAITFDHIAVWRDDAKGAYSMIHDDVCGGALRGIDRYAVPAMGLRKLSAGLGPYVEACEDGGIWSVVNDAEMKGHEIINHSYTHPNVTALNMDHEITMAKTTFDGKIKNPVTFYIFPFDYFNAMTIKAAGDAGHLGARAGSRDDNDGFENQPLNDAMPMPGKDMEIEFDVWPRTYSKYALFTGNEILNLHAYNAADKGMWAMREMHSISALPNPPQDGSEGFGPVPLRVYEDHLDFLVQAWKTNTLWTAPPTTVLKYRQARVACKAAVAGNTITYTADDPICIKYATAISVIVKTANDVPGLKALQGTTPIFTRKLAANTFSVSADPTKGTVTLEGCMQPSSKVDTTLPLPAKATPANSVCDLENVIGKGMPGNMDNLNRGFDQLQVLPNPAQGDGRTGSWSWYPGEVMVDIVREPNTNNGYLRYAGTNLGVWSGTTLAFLGGNGAGACYDASVYTGVRFKIKGTVASTDLLANAVIVSLVSAETQTRKYGGDLKEEGGHWNKPIAITPDWTTVSIPFKDFLRPTWGVTADVVRFPGLATKKMQAIDWGVTDKATSFEIFLDDIELY
jgi:peptidoglycan/xylan/chitin deacetylase (PgdA/CDA1 family)